MYSKGEMATNNFGECDECSGVLRPVWFIEEEYETVHGMILKTGRKRRAVSHLVCEIRLKNYAIDDSFDGPWR